MSETLQRLLKRHFPDGVGYVAIPAIIYTVELTIWAGLNLSGITETWMQWRVCLLIALVIIFYTKIVFEARNKSYKGLALIGVIFPWLILFIGIAVWGFVQMNLSFVTIDLFFWGVIASGVTQFIFIIVSSYVID
jgi:hypothetical protein